MRPFGPTHGANRVMESLRDTSMKQALQPTGSVTTTNSFYINPIFYSAWILPLVHALRLIYNGHVTSQPIHLQHVG